MKNIGLFIIASLFTSMAFADDSASAPAAPQTVVPQTSVPSVGTVVPIDISKLKSGQTTLRVGHYNQLPPFYFSNGNPQSGFGYDIFTEVAKKAGIQNVRFIGFDSNINLNMQLLEGKIDVIANSWDLPGMRKQFLLSTPYYKKGGLSFLYFKDKGSFLTVDDLKDHNIGVFHHGYADRYWLPAHGIPQNLIKTYPSIKELMFALRAGDVDVAVVYYPLAQLAQLQLTDQLASTLIQPINDVYAVRTQDTELLKTLNEAIEALTKDGTIDKIPAQYLNPAQS